MPDSVTLERYFGRRAIFCSRCKQLNLPPESFDWSNVPVLCCAWAKRMFQEYFQGRFGRTGREGELGPSGGHPDSLS